MKQGMILHDIDLGMMALKINENLNIKNFVASETWIRKYKRTHRITSRKITKLIGKKKFNDDEKIDDTIDSFREKIKNIMKEVPLSAIINADQSGLQKHLTTGRTLAPKGARDVKCVVQSVCSTTHSYTILPLLFANGTLGEKLFIVLQEPSGSFPKKGYFDAPNLVVTCHTSHIMTKSLTDQWLNTCFG